MVPKRLRKYLQSDKRDLVMAILNGNIDYSVLMPPQFYQVMEEDDLFTINQQGHPEKILTREQYAEWELTLRDQDMVFHIVVSDFKDSPLLTDAEVQELEREVKQPTPTIKQNIEAVKQPENSLQGLPLSGPVNETEETHLIEVKATSGKLSDYGTTWEVSKQKYGLN
jgi:hypothetical protein